jgi:hypothetical protein
MPWLVLFFGFQAGLVSQTVALGGLTWQSPASTVEATMSVRALALDHLEVSAFMRSWQSPDASFPSFDPFRIDYGVEASVVYGPLRAGVSHECDHPVSRFYDGKIEGVPPNGDFTEFFVRFESRVQF